MTQLHQPTPTDDARWPGVGSAYDFVLPSYQLLVNRYEAADGRLSQSITLAATLLFSIPLFARNVRPDVSFQSPLFAAAIGLLTFAALYGVVGRQIGRLRLVNPAHLYQQWLHLSQWEFQKDMVYFAGADFADNARIIDRKGKVSALVNTAVVIALLLAVIWLSR